MNNPFAPQPSPAPTAPNPFAPAAPQPGVAAIQAAFAAQPTAPSPAVNPFAAAQPQPPAPTGPLPASVVMPPAPTPQVTAFAPLNPPGEAGLGGPPPAATVQVAPVAPAATVQAAEPASPKRSRKPRAKADAPALVGGHYTPDVGGHEVTVYTPAEVDSMIDLGAESPDLSKVSTEDLREALKSRGWTVQLTDG